MYEGHTIRYREFNVDSKADDVVSYVTQSRDQMCNN